MRRQVEREYRAVFVDRPREIRLDRDSKVVASRLFALPGMLDDLHDFARELGLRPAWYQEHAVLPHYDLVDTMVPCAIGRGAREADQNCVREAVAAWLKVRARTRREALLAQQREPDGSIRNPRFALNNRNQPLTDDEAHQEFERCRARLRGQ